MEKPLNKQIYLTVYSHSSDLKLNQYSSADEIRDTIRWIMRDNPDIFWFAHQYHYDEASSTIHFQYTFSAERVKTIQQSINDVIENDFCIEYVKKLNLQEQVAYIYKWLVTYCTYNANSAYNQSIYSVFVRRNSVCTGYAKAAQYLFNLLGIESRLVFGRLHNDKEDGRHCWNLVKVDNGYYHFDACFGDSILDNVAIKSGVQKLFKIDGINYNFLCVSTDEILRTRSIEDITTLPECHTSWHKTFVNSLAQTELQHRKGIRGCLLSHIGSSADIYLCSKDKNTVLKVFRPNSKTTSQEEYHYMQQIKGCRHLLQCNEQYTDITQNIVAIEQSTPIVDLLCSHYYELSLKGLIKMATDVAKAWKECQKRGVLYRDIHICNIYRSNDGTFKLGDIGSCTNKFELKETVGNLWFMAPETFVYGVFTEASAVYSISMVMYFILNNLRPAFWTQGCEYEALQKRMYGENLPILAGCINLPPHIKTKLDKFFWTVSASLLKERISSIEEFIYELKMLTYYCKEQDYIIHRKGISLDLDLDARNSDRLGKSWNYIPRDTYHRYAIECVPKSKMKNSTQGINDWCRRILDRLTIVRHIATFTAKPVDNCAHADEVESFARTMASAPCTPSAISPVMNITEAVESYSNTMGFCENKRATYNATVQKSKKSIWSKLFGDRYNEVYSSIFAPAEVKRKSHLQVQVYLHLYEESEKVKSFAQESDKNAERRDYIPLSLKLKKGDKVDVEFNVYGETRLTSDRKYIIWQGAFTKCSFDYFVPKDLDVEELSCVALLSVNGVPIGEMRFITRVIETPRQLNPEIIAHKYSKVFISYSHLDESKVKFLHEGLELGSVPHFFDRKYLKAGDVFPQVIQDYINSADLFILCWSENASKSEYVQKERLQALERAFPQVQPENAAKLRIYPMNIEPRAELPRDMKNYYHFGEI